MKPSSTAQHDPLLPVRRFRALCLLAIVLAFVVVELHKGGAVAATQDLEANETRLAQAGVSAPPAGANPVDGTAGVGARLAWSNPRKPVEP